MRYLTIVFFACGIILFSCKKDKVPEILPVENCEVSFAVDITPIINVNCSTSGCHDSGSAASGYDLTTYASISTNADIILSVMNHESGVAAMPFGQPKIADTTIAKFSCWTANGALEN